MPKSDTQFKSTGLDIPHGQQPISTKFPAAVDAILRDKTLVRDRSAYIRAAVLKQLQSDGLLP